MELLIVTPSSGKARTGNHHTASQWSEYLTGMGHRVKVSNSYAGEAAEILIALHASKSHDSIAAFRDVRPHSPIVVILTGTDVYPEPNERTLASLRMADRIVALQPRVRDRIPAEFHDRVSVIVQAAEISQPPPAHECDDPFDICVVAHLREVKDPLRAAAASRLLPASSKIRIRHAGAILESGYREKIEREQSENGRFEWLGEIDSAAVHRLMAACRLLVVSSFFEGGARVIGESIVAGTPLLAARNDGSCSLLGDDYPGLYEAGNTAELANLMERAESDPEFMECLRGHTKPLAGRFAPQRERKAVRDLIDGLDKIGKGAGNP